MPANGEQADRTEENEAKHALASSWFLGPRVEALEVLQSLFEQALKRHKQTRDELANEDRYFFITEDMKKLDIYQESIATRETNSESLSEIPAKHSVPFWSPRYNAHMNMDTTLASIIRCKPTCARPLEPQSLMLEISRCVALDLTMLPQRQARTQQESRAG